MSAPDTFTAKCRRAYWQGVPPKHIAAALGCPVARVELALFARVAPRSAKVCVAC